MNRHLALPLAATLVVSAPLTAQDYVGQANIFYSIDSRSDLASMNTSNTATDVVESQILSFAPGTSQTFARPYNHFTFWPALVGDEDNDGLLIDTGVGDLDALWVRNSAPQGPSIHDMYMSIGTRVEAFGALATAIEPGDIFRITEAGTIETLLTSGQVQIATGSTSSGLDVNGFTVDRSNGDLYLTTRTRVIATSGFLANANEVFRIRSSSYVRTGNRITFVAPNSAQLVLSSSDVNSILTASGSSTTNSREIAGLEIDPSGGTFTSPTTGRTMPNLWFTLDTLVNDIQVYSTAGPTPTVNGLPLFPGTLGLVQQPPPPFGGRPDDNIVALAFQGASPIGAAPLTVATRSIQYTTPDSFPIDVAGVTSRGNAFLILEVAGVTPGSFIPRLGNFSSLLPFPTSSASFDVFFGLNSIATLPVVADTEGFATFPVTLGPLVGGFAFSWQAVDLSTVTLSTPVVIEVL